MLLTPLGAVLRGAAAGVVGTAAMDLVWYARYKRGGGDQSFPGWELSSGLTWDSAPAPALVGRRVVEGYLQRPLPESAAALVNNVVHWQFGAFNGAVYGLLAGSLAKPKLRYGPLLGTAVWLSGYVLLPPAGLYQPLWKYDLKTLAKDWSAHLAFGTATAATFRVLAW